MASNDKGPAPGVRVRFTDAHLHEMDPQYYPPAGTVGKLRASFEWMQEGWWFVQWPAGTTKGNGLWSAPLAALEVVGDDQPEDDQKGA